MARKAPYGNSIDPIRLLPRVLLLADARARFAPLFPLRSGRLAGYLNDEFGGMQMEMSEHEKQWLTDQGAEMIATFGVEERSSVIDFGCGKGRYAIPLSQVVGENGNVLAVERDSDEVAVLRERIAAFGGQGPIRVLSSEDVRLQSVDDGTIDSVFAFDVLQYLEDWEIFFRSVRRVLRPGGSIHVYPAAVPHPGTVDVELVASTMNEIGLRGGGRRRFRMMHNRDMVTDEVYTFSLSD